MDFNIAASERFEEKETVLGLLHRLTGDKRWREESYFMPYAKAFVLDFLPGDQQAAAFISACHAIGATRLEPPSEFKTQSVASLRLSTSRAFQLPSQWEGDRLEDRVFLRVLAKHDMAVTYDGTAEKKQHAVSLRCTCDEWGNVFKQNEAAFVTAYQKKLQDAASLENPLEAVFQIEPPQPLM